MKGMASAAWERRLFFFLFTQTGWFPPSLRVFILLKHDVEVRPLLSIIVVAKIRRETTVVAEYEQLQ